MPPERSDRTRSLDRSISASPSKRSRGSNLSNRVLDNQDVTLLDLVDRLLSKGVMASGDLVLGVAGVDLIYVRLSALLCAVDRVLPLDPRGSRKRSRYTDPLESLREPRPITRPRHRSQRASSSRARKTP